MLEQARKIYPAPKHKTQKRVGKFRENDFMIKILFLRVDHPKINPIEMVWGCVKRAVVAKKFRLQVEKRGYCHKDRNC